MRSISGGEFAQMVQRRGWRPASDQRQPSHLRKAESVVQLSIPIHGNRLLKTGLLRHLAKLAEIPDAELR